MAGFDDLPERHDRHPGRYTFVLNDGAAVDLRISTASRPLRGNELVRAEIGMRMGRAPAMRVEETEISLNVGRSGRMDIKALPSGFYGYGRHVNRSLRELVKELVVMIGHEVEPSAEAPKPRF